MKTQLVATTCFLLCGCASSNLNGSNNVTVTTSQRVVQAPGCRFVGNVDETADNGGATDISSASDEVRAKMQNSVSTMGGNVLLLLSIKSGGYASVSRGTGEGYWCPANG